MNHIASAIALTASKKIQAVKAQKDLFGEQLNVNLTIRATCRTAGYKPPAVGTRLLVYSGSKAADKPAAQIQQPSLFDFSRKRRDVVLMKK